MLVILTAKLDIGSLLTSSPSPPPRPTPKTTQLPPSSSCCISAPTSTSHYPLVTSPSTSSTSQYSISTAPPNPYRQPQPQISTAAVRIPAAQPRTAATRRRGPPTDPHPDASPAKKEKNQKWTAQEDARLISLRGANMKWADVAARIPGRSETSCRLRYQNYVEKDMVWTEARKDKFARLYDRYILAQKTPSQHLPSLPITVLPSAHKD